MLDTIGHDIRTGLRGFRRTPAITVAAVLTLALGIGLSTAVFSVASILLVRPLPVQEQDRLVVLWGASHDHQYDNVPLVDDDARTFRRASHALSRIAFFAREGALAVPATIATSTTTLNRSLVSGDFFDILGTRPVLGRGLRAEDDAIGAPAVAVLSYAGWQRRFGGDPSVVGRHFQIPRTGADFTVVGVMPQGLDYPRGTDFWAAVTAATTAAGTDHPFLELDVLGRLSHDATPAIARDELTAFFSRDGTPLIQRGVHGVAHTLPELVVGDAKPAILIFAAAAGLLLLVTCINVANLLFIRSVGRVREIAVRAALGASRARIVRQLLTESALLAIAGGSIGAVVAALSLTAFVALAPNDVPRLDEIRVGALTLWSAMAIATFATVLFGVAPAIVAARRNADAALRSGTRHTASRGLRRATETLVVGQVALALMILSGAGLVARSLLALEHVRLAYDASRLVLADLTLRPGQFDGREKQIALLDRVLPRVTAIPGVLAVTPVGNVPFSGAGIDGVPALDGQTPADASKNPFVSMEAVESNYFATLGISLVAGRAFTDTDRGDAPHVAIVNQSFAARFWPGQSAIGKRIQDGGGKLTVVGVVPDVRYRDLRFARPSLYLPLRQSPFPFAPMTLAIRTAGRPGAIVASLRATVADVDASVGLSAVRSFDELLSGPLAHPRLNTALLAMFACAALALAAVGLFGVMMATVRQRTGELGIRMALGATATEIGRSIAGRGARLTAIGVVAGLAGALALDNLLTELLYDVAPTDVATLGGVTIMLIALATLATLLPAVASMRIDPVIALRSPD